MEDGQSEHLPTAFVTVKAKCIHLLLCDIAKVADEEWLSEEDIHCVKQ
jgi:hypothetical protein